MLLMCNALLTKIVSYDVLVPLMLAWQLQPELSGNAVGAATAGWPEAVDGGKPWQMVQEATARVAGNKAVPQAGERLLPVMSPPGIFAPWQ
jgi:hypothetical protein